MAKRLRPLKRVANPSQGSYRSQYLLFKEDGQSSFLLLDSFVSFHSPTVPSICQPEHSQMDEKPGRFVSQSAMLKSVSISLWRHVQRANPCWHLSQPSPEARGLIPLLLSSHRSPPTSALVKGKSPCRLSACLLSSYKKHWQGSQRAALLRHLSLCKFMRGPD